MLTRGRGGILASSWRQFEDYKPGPWTDVFGVNITAGDEGTQVVALDKPLCPPVDGDDKHSPKRPCYGSRHVLTNRDIVEPYVAIQYADGQPRGTTSIFFTARDDRLDHTLPATVVTIAYRQGVEVAKETFHFLARQECMHVVYSDVDRVELHASFRVYGLRLAFDFLHIF
jgi:hypothetical protein